MDSTNRIIVGKGINQHENLNWIITIAFIIGILFISLAILITPQNKKGFEKKSSYECGFEPFNDARQKFEIRFYLIGILFIIFDLEIALLIPWAMTCSHINTFGTWVTIDFLAELVVGYILAVESGALDWD